MWDEVLGLYLMAYAVACIVAGDYIKRGIAHPSSMKDKLPALLARSAQHPLVLGGG